MSTSQQQPSAGGTRHASTFQAIDPRTGEPIAPMFTEADDAAVDAAVAAAAAAVGPFGDAPLEMRAELLRGIASRLDDARAEIVATADRETGLGEGRLEGELDRTCNQLRMFADVVSDGTFLDVIIDTETATSPDLRRYLRPLGPVAVFGASNFPLAFSVAGGDTASALAAGCPVVVKGHPAHPSTSERCGEAIADAVVAAGLPHGVFSLLQAAGVDAARRLVQAPAVSAVGFTGSQEAGRALFDLAAARPTPIPVYAEMGSLNPMVVTPGAAETRAEDVAQRFVGSIVLGTGQFCTKPGLLFVPDDGAGRDVERLVADELGGARVEHLLHPGVRDRLASGVARLRGTEGVELLAELAPGDGAGIRHPAVVFVTDTETLATVPSLQEEQFGPVALLVRYASASDLDEALCRLPGSLTGTIHATEGESELRGRIQRTLLERVGRVVHDGVPTGVAVTPSMHHGGPYPATTSPLHTSVGATAVRRFQRPVLLQDAPVVVLPDALRDENPLGIWRRVDGELTKDPIG